MPKPDSMGMVVRERTLSSEKVDCDDRATVDLLPSMVTGYWTVAAPMVQFRTWSWPLPHSSPFSGLYWRFKVILAGVIALQPRVTWNTSRPLKESSLMEPSLFVDKRSNSAVLALQLIASPAASNAPEHTPSLAQPDWL